MLSGVVIRDTRLDRRGRVIPSHSEAIHPWRWLRNLALSILVSTAFAGAFDAKAQRLSVTFLNPGLSDEGFWPMVTAAMQAAADDLDIELEVIYAGRDRQMLRRAGLSVAERPSPPDFLVVANNDPVVLDILKAADSAGVPTLLLFNDVDGEDRDLIGGPRTKLPNWLGSLVADNVAAGRRLASAAIDAGRRTHAVGEQLQMVALLCERTDPTSRAMRRGIYQAVEAADDVVIDRVLYAEGSRSLAKRLTQRYVAHAATGGGTPAIIVASSGAMAAGAADSLDDSGLRLGQDVIVASVGWDTEAVDEEAQGRFEIDDGGHVLAGAWALVLLRDFADGSDFEDLGTTIRFDLLALDGSRARTFVERFLDRGWSKIDFSMFRRAGDEGYRFTMAPPLGVSAGYH